jgi:hypothetical protein
MRRLDDREKDRVMGEFEVFLVGLSPEMVEAVTEREAILEFDGGLSRSEAEALAVACLKESLATGSR